MTPKELRALLESSANAVQARYYIPWKVMVAQVALETGWMQHPIKDYKTGKDSHNLFAIKADPSWHGPYVTTATHEVVGGKTIQVQARFRAYATYTESFADYAQFVMRNPRYKSAMLHTKDPVRFARELAAAGYATDPQYAEKLCSIMARYLA